LRSKKLFTMALTIGVLMLTPSIIGTVAAKVPPENIHATVYGWGRVERTRGSASLSVGFGTAASGHEGKSYVLITFDDVTYGWEITKVKQYRSTLYVYAKSLGGHQGVGVEPGPGYLVMRVGMHGSDWAWVIAWGRRTFFIGS
jgi:hypothetical protein